MIFRQEIVTQGKHIKGRISAFSNRFFPNNPADVSHHGIFVKCPNEVTHSFSLEDINNVIDEFQKLKEQMEAIKLAKELEK